MKSDFFYNIYKSSYIIPYENKYLIIGKSMCLRTTEEALFLITNLPENGTQIEYLSCLDKLGINNPFSIFNELCKTNILIQKKRKMFLEYLKEMFNIKIQIISGQQINNIINKLRLNNLLVINQNKNHLLFLFISILIIGLIISLTVFFGASTVFFGNKISVFIVVIGILFHEFGHSLLAYLCGIGFRGIGFSFYLFFPVFYTNVSGIDLLNKKKRILINMGGLFFHALFLIFLGILYLINGNDTILLSYKMLSSLFLLNFNPAFKSDGYWALKDYSDLTNNKLSKWINRGLEILAICFTYVIIINLLKNIKHIIYIFQNYNQISFSISVIFQLLFYIYISIFIFFILFKRIKSIILSIEKKLIRDHS